jgi:type II secretory pathway component PulC
MAILVMLCSPAFAQEDTDELDEKMREAERRLVEQEREMAETVREMELQRAEHEREMAEAEREMQIQHADREREMLEVEREIELQHAERERQMAEAVREMELQRAERERAMRDENIEVEIRMREAEAAMAEAARHVAELSSRQLPRVAAIQRIIRSGNRPVLGITIGSDDDDGPVEGVAILGISPGGAAQEAGLRAGDVMTAVNDEPLTADTSREANAILLDFMQGVEEGDALTVEYLRNGKAQTVEVAPRQMQGGVFAFDFDGSDFTVPDVHGVPNVKDFNRYVWMSGGSGLGDMELVKLTERLGSYFGADEGLLVVRAPKNEDLKLQDGDVIQSIDGRKPTSVNHAMRILGSYQSGETVSIEIMRDKRRQTISIEVPDDRQSSVVPPPVPKVYAAPAVKIVPAPADPRVMGSDLY